MLENVIKTALVIGVRQGNIGEAIARQLLWRHAAHVRYADLQQYEGPLYTHTRGMPVVMDVRDQSSIDEAFDRFARDHTRLDLVVNCAGINLLGPLETYAEEDFERTLDINLTSQYRLLKAYQRTFGHTKTRKTFIALTSNTGTFVARTNSMAYAASKAGANALLQSAARELNKSQPGRWAIIPFAAGPVTGTPMDTRTAEDVARQRCMSESEARRLLLANVPEGRGMTPDEVAEWVCFLAQFGYYASGNIVRVDNNQQQG